MTAIKREEVDRAVDHSLIRPLALTEGRPPDLANAYTRALTTGVQELGSGKKLKC